MSFITSRYSPVRVTSSVPQPYYYPDPTTIRGNVAFDIRLSELARLQSDTVRYEESVRISNTLRRSQHASKIGGRPSSARDSQRPARPQVLHRQSLPGALERGPKASQGLLSPQLSYPGTQNSCRVGRTSRPSSAVSRCGDSKSPVQTSDGLGTTFCTSRLLTQTESQCSSPNTVDLNSRVKSEKGSDHRETVESTPPEKHLTPTVIVQASRESNHQDVPPAVVLSDTHDFDHSKRPEGETANEESSQEDKPLLESERCQNGSSPEDGHPTSIDTCAESLNKGSKQSTARIKKTKAKRKTSPEAKSNCTLKVDRVSSTTSVSSSSTQCSQRSHKSSSQAGSRRSLKRRSKGSTH